MRVLLDSNVIIDVLERREEFFDDSYAVVCLAAKGEIEALVAAGCISDIYYIIRRNGNLKLTRFPLANNADFAGKSKGGANRPCEKPASRWHYPFSSAIFSTFLPR